MTTQRVVITSGEYSDYSIDATLGVPSMDWLTERMKEYKALVDELTDEEDFHEYATQQDSDKKWKRYEEKYPTLVD